jgi:predicted TIM-barrel fold metal-dependent hydrolase
MAANQNNPIKQKIEQNDPKGAVLKFRQTGLMCGELHVISIHRPCVIIDSHMHIQSGRCATLPYLWSAAPGFIQPVAKKFQLSRPSVETSGKVWSYVPQLYEVVAAPARAIKGAFSDQPKNPEEGVFRKNAIRQLVGQQAKTTEEIGDDFMAERKTVFENFFKKEAEYKDLSHLVLCSVIMTMDMEYAHVDGYYDIKIYNPVYADDDFTKKPIHYWFPLHGVWEQRGTAYARVVDKNTSLFPKRGQTQQAFEKFTETAENLGIIGCYRDTKGSNQRELIKITAAPCLVDDTETDLYEPWTMQAKATELSALKNPLQLLPLFHFDPRRWQPEGLGEVFKSVSYTSGGIYLGFKMYTAQGYRPWDVRRLPVLEKFYAECCQRGLPVLNHCTPEGAASFDREEYFDFTHPNDTDEDQQQKDAYRGPAGKDTNAESKVAYFNEHFVSPDAWRKVLDATVGGTPLKTLRLCLAHFGGATTLGQEWAEQIIRMMVEYPNVYADISSSFVTGRFRALFKEVMQNNPNAERIKDRILFGTDWYMTLYYENQVVGKNYWDYCTETKRELDSYDTSLWPRFTQHNPYRFYRLDDDRQIGRIAENIIAGRQTKEMLKVLPKLESDKIILIRKEAAWIKQANVGFINP